MFYLEIYVIFTKLKILRWWLHYPGLRGGNFNPFSRDRFRPAITRGNQILFRQGGTVFRLVFV